MAEGDDEVEIGVKAPPKSIEISAPEQATFTSPIQSEPGNSQTLTGGVSQLGSQDAMQNNPENFKFIMGPNGQLIAVAKPPFVWKDFFIGGGIPFALFFIPVLLLMIGEGLGYGTGNMEEIKLSKIDNSSAYMGEFSLGDEEYLQWCSIYEDNENTTYDYLDIYCNPIGDQDAEIIDNSRDGEVIGYYEGDNGTLYFDSGVDYDSELYLRYEYTKEDGPYMFFETVSELVGFTCCFGLLLSIILLIIGFSQGKPGMGWGGVSALLSFPVVSVVALMVMW